MGYNFDLFVIRLMFFLALCFFETTKIMAQEGEREYVPFVEEGKIWYCGEGRSINCIFTMSGDTLINDREYKKVYCQCEDFYEDMEQHYYCSVREKDCQVFIIEEKATEEKLMYDFSHPEEIILLTYNDFPFARTDGERRHDFLPGQMEYLICRFSEGEVDYSNDSSSWIDGVGAPLSNPFAFEFSHLLFDKPKLGINNLVISCMKGDKIIFYLDWMAEPIEPASIDADFQFNDSQAAPHLYDLQGRRLNGIPQKGVYIQNGRKYVK